MKKLIFLSLLFLALTSWSAEIIFPWRAASAIVKRGNTFEVWFNADKGQDVLSVNLQATYNMVKPSFEIEKGNWVYDQTSGNTFNTKITVSVPSKTPVERYDVILKTASAEFISPAAVKVIKNYKSSYYILHLSDLHAFQKGHETVMSRLSLVADIANIINPEMVFNTGDNLYRPNEERMTSLYEGDEKAGLKGLNHFLAPTFTVAGNHDIDFDNMPEQGFYKEKAAWWNKWWGLQSYQIKYGKARFLAINNGWHGFDPAEQLTATANWLKQKGTGNLRVGLAHIRNNEMDAFDSIANLGLVLLGHNHYIANQNPTPLNGKPIQFIVNSMRDNMEFNLYKVNNKTGQVTPMASSTAQVTYVENPTDIKKPSLYKPLLQLSYLLSNDGKNKHNRATVINNFNFTIEKAKVRFVMPKGKKYKISKGSIEQTFDGSNVHVVDLLVDLAPKSTTVVEIN